MGSSGGGGGGDISKPGAIAGGIGSIVQGVGQDVQTGIANVMNMANRAEALRNLDVISPDSAIGQQTRGQLFEQVQRMAENADQTMGRFNSIRDASVSDLQSLRDRSMAYLTGAGEQERRDINTSFDNRAAASQADLVSRGLGGTTAMPGALSQNERFRRDALGGLEERLRQQNLSWDTSLTGNIISQRQSLDMSGLNLMQQLFGRQQAGQNQAHTFWYQQYVDDALRRVGLISGFQNIPPDPALSANISAGLGSLGATPPQAANPDTTTPALIGSGTALASTGILAGTSSGLGGSSAGVALSTKAFSMTCIDADAEILMADGSTKKLRDVHIGDRVSGGGEVVKKDCGMPWAERENDYIRLHTSDASLVLTTDHVVGGRPASKWMAGDRMDEPQTMYVTGVEKHKAVESGDLRISGQDWYIANGFKVSSII